MTLPAGFLTKHVSHVEVGSEHGCHVIRFNLVVENGKVERVETSFDRLHARLPSVFREDHSMYEISPFQAGMVVTEAERMILGSKQMLKKERAEALTLIYRHTHRDFKGTLPDGSKTLLTMTGLVCLDELTCTQVAELLPSAQRKEAARLEAKQKAKA
jgi:hypothetical protein